MQLIVVVIVEVVVCVVVVVTVDAAPECRQEKFPFDFYSSY